MARAEGLYGAAHFCADIACEVNATKLKDGAKKLAQVQRRAVQAANERFAAAAADGMGAQVVPMLDIVNMLIPALPLIGLDASHGSLLWDPLIEARIPMPPPAGPETPRPAPGPGQATPRRPWKPGRPTPTS